MPFNLPVSAPKRVLICHDNDGNIVVYLTKKNSLKTILPHSTLHASLFTINGTIIFF